MNKKQIYQTVSTLTGHNKKDVEHIIEAFLHIIINAINLGEPVRITGFLSFMWKETKQKIWTHPETKVRQEIPKRLRLVIKKSNRIRRTLPWKSSE